MQNNYGGASMYPPATPNVTGQWVPAQETERLLALDHLTQRVGAINARLSDLSAALAKHADSIFGPIPWEEPTGANVPPQPSARLEGLAQSMNVTERYLEFLSDQVERFRAL